MTVIRHMRAAFVAVLLAAAPASAQVAAAPATTAPATTAPAAVASPAKAAETQDASMFLRSLMFSPLEVTAVTHALSGATTSLLNANQQQVIPLRRTIAVSGIVWRAEGDWIAWINGRKVTPGKLLPEIVDIKVDGDKVDLKWFDIGINGIISITLRPHQTYDIVTGVLLPG